MKLLLALTALVGSTLAQSCSLTGLSCSAGTSSGDSCCSPKYGLLVLNLQWVKGFGPNNAFTLHGLWPDTCSGGYGPSSGCDNSRNSNSVASIIQSLDSNLYDTMQTYWPSNTGDNNKFWSHEWNKHGTCVTTLDPKCYSDYQENEELVDYFQKAIDLRQKYNVYQALSAKGITPGGTYSADAIRAALKAQFGVSGYIDCSSGTLSAVELFFYVQGKDDYQLTDAIATGSCSGNVKYPKK
ncbi:ribonuclease T2-like protein [Sporodiniella umbellata]|nr:ribonuclease T2-like protein [Sporodiniella umbellata]